MSEVQWIKIASSIFDNRKIRMIESMPDGYAIIIVWLKLLCLAGSINDMGMIYFTTEIPYTEQMLSTQFNMPLTTVQLALKTFEQFRMIETVDSMLHISNWERYQNIDAMEKLKADNRKRVAKFREKQKALQLAEGSNVTECNVTSNVTVTECNDTDKNKIRKDIEENIYINNANDKTEKAENVENSVEKP